MWDTKPFCRRELRSTNVHPLVNLHRIGIDDFALQFLRQGKGKLRLA